MDWPREKHEERRKKKKKKREGLEEAFASIGENSTDQLNASMENFLTALLQIGKDRELVEKKKEGKRGVGGADIVMATLYPHHSYRSHSASMRSKPARGACGGGGLKEGRRAARLPGAGQDRFDLSFRAPGGGASGKEKRKEEIEEKGKGVEKAHALTAMLTLEAYSWRFLMNGNSQKRGKGKEERKEGERRE